MLILLILGVVQGITEFLPVSSSGHLLFFQTLFNITGDHLAMDVFLHGATLLVIICYFFKDLWRMFRAFCLAPLNMKNPDVRLVYLILAANIPTALFGLLLEKRFGFVFERLPVLLVTWPVTAFLLILSDRIGEKQGLAGRLPFSRALLIGLAQGFAVLPGLSRSGITIAAGLFLNLKRDESARFSFLAGLPAMAGALILESRKFAGLNYSLPVLSLAFLVTFAAGLFSMILLLKTLNMRKFRYFGFYLAGLALLTGARVLFKG